MSRWMNYASNLLDSVDSIAKEHLHGDTESAAIEAEMRRRSRKEQVSRSNSPLPSLPASPALSSQHQGGKVSPLSSPLPRNAMPMSQEEQQVESAVLQTQPADRPDGALSPKDAATVKKLRQTIHELHLELEELEERNDGQERELKLIADRALREEAHTRQLRTQLEAAKAAHDESSERAEDAMAMVRSLEAKVEALREAEYVAAGDLRGQLDAARAAAAATHEADVSRLRLAHGRQAELEIQNAQMSKELAAMQKELDAANSTVEMYAQEAQQAAIPPAAEELTSLQLKLTESNRRAAQAAKLQSEAESETHALRQEILTIRAGAEDMQRNLEVRLEASSIEVAHLQQSLKIMEGNASKLSNPDQVSALMEQLLTRQRELEELSCEKSTLVARLRKAIARADQAEAILNRGMGYVDEGFMEMGMDRSPTTNSYGASNRLASRGTTRSNHAMSQLKPIAQNRQIARAADVIDRAMMITGRFLWRVPMARLAFLLYLILLHAWSMFVLSIFAQHVLEDHQLGAVNGAIPVDH